MNDPFISFGSLTQKELPLHRNVGMEVVYVSEGRPRWVVDSRAENVPAGSVFFTLPWQAHGSEYIHESGNVIHYVQFRLDKNYETPPKRFAFHPGLGVPERDAKRMGKILFETPRHSWPATLTLEWLILTLVNRLETGGSPLLIRGLFLGMLSELVDIIARNEPDKPHRDATEQRVQKLLLKIESECANAWPLEKLMQQTGLRATQLTAVVKRLTGDSPVAYLKRARIMRAEALLTTTDKSITDIAFDCGFSTTQLFCRTFKKFTNRTPTQYRRNQREKTEQHVQQWTDKEERARHAALRRHEWI